MWLLPLLCYLSASAFLAGMGWRVLTWLRTPVPLKIVLTPGPVTTAGVVRRLAGEALLFRSLLGADGWLWSAAWLFHLSLVFLAVGHLGGLVFPGFARATLGLTLEQYTRFALVTGGAFGILAALPLVFLLIRRLALARLHYISTFSDYFALALLLLTIATGNQMRFLGKLDLAQAEQFVSGVIMFHPAAPPAGAAFTAHVLLVCALLAFIPFSKLVHLGGLFFSPTLNQKNDPRQSRHIGPWDLQAETRNPRAE